ncbi:MAG: ubiquinol oxidase subunit II [Chromatiaceae bacterium]|nr:ubiquinol oxidase subunit II [Chromatiaceae bacterium]MCP5314466.1 ubiquinol oxidase subunit II [Chromatiaceae bacterium]
MAAIPLMLIAGACMAADLVDVDPSGPIALRERDLMLVAFGLMLIVLIPVFTMTAWFAWRYRATNIQANYAPDWSSTRLDVIVWLVPAAIVAVLAWLTWTSTHRLNPYKPIESDIPPLSIQVVALDWKWLFIYPQQGIATVNQLVIPVGRPVSFDITSNTVMNSFFIPQLGGQVYAMAGMRTELHLLADRPGTVFGENTQYSGRGFPYQHFEVTAKPAAEFDAWINDVKKRGGSLTQVHFETLARPSIREPVHWFGSVENGLFKHIINQFTTATQAQ